jgi:hypothetical protein
MSEEPAGCISNWEADKEGGGTVFVWTVGTHTLVHTVSQHTIWTAAKTSEPLKIVFNYNLFLVSLFM